MQSPASNAAGAPAQPATNAATSAAAAPAANTAAPAGPGPGASRCAVEIRSARVRTARGRHIGRGSQHQAGGESAAGAVFAQGGRRELGPRQAGDREPRYADHRFGVFECERGRHAATLVGPLGGEAGRHRTQGGAALHYAVHVDDPARRPLERRRQSALRRRQTHTADILRYQRRRRPYDRQCAARRLRQLGSFGAIRNQFPARSRSARHRTGDGAQIVRPRHRRTG